MATQRTPAKRRHNIHDLTDLRVGLYCRVSRENDADDKSIREKSVDDQEREGREWAKRHKCRVVRTYRDAGRSASRFATKEREDFTELGADIKANKLDVVWFWEQSRSTRRLGVYAELRDLCRDHGVLWVIRDRVYDPNNTQDMLSPAIQAILSEDESEKISLRVTRGKKSGAEAGRPASRPPYGYRRVYDPATGRSSHDVPDTWDGNGRPVEDSPAFIVRDIFARLAGGSTILSIFRDLNDRRVPTSNGSIWYQSTIRRIAKNPAYVGLRVYHGEILDGVPGFGPPLVDPETFWAVQRIITDPARSTWRATPASTALVSSIARCAECGGLLIQGKRHDGDRVTRFYHCREKDCTAIDTPKLDEYVEAQIIDWLSNPDVAAALTAGDHSEAAKLARADADRARHELDEWRHLIERGEITAAGYAVAEKAILARIHAADETAQAATMPIVLRGKLGRQAKSGWKKLDRDGKRTIIRAVADIRLKRSERWQRGPSALPVQERVDWKWLLIDPDEGDAD
jgi:DNA invertase Pin-like site-specific DNA recombinase